MYHRVDTMENLTFLDAGAARHEALMVETWFTFYKPTVSSH